ncbi:citrate lyase holo-[acyl-carrier protein] synthase [Fundicoccus culcitae]|uniref:citrate lyase holo-[acyl-carrier protein] synthase n=1 Tax=Fundicoccus culcitae TaxID=2969821 RepID=A0ABY5P3T4_9LACT|nr:citrate lyase holo-[acyl-carrier protein] synthase [Fundicoccus culcitae]UUX33209.1 citrate lyase holo-[acyl-carrier protein] synthase [Fundicoccus culcitae]
MFNDIFLGETVTLIDMLNARDERYAKQNSLLSQYPGCSLLVVTMNIPGDIKNSQKISEVFKSAIEIIDQELVGASLKHKSSLQQHTGNEAYYVLDIPAVDLKRLMIAIEEQHPQGRLFDLDVLFVDEDTGAVAKISRADYNLMPRQCFVCDKNAKECARSRAHSIQEMKVAVANLMAKQ